MKLHHSANENPARVGRSRLLLLVVKGNLRHRVEKLGSEKMTQDLSVPQKKLRDIARRGRVDDTPKGGAPFYATAERPEWANGSFVYLNEFHTEITGKIRELVGFRLRTKHVLVSQEYKTTLMEALSSLPEGSGRELFLLRRAGAIESEEEISLPTDDKKMALDLKSSPRRQSKQEGPSEDTGHRPRRLDDADSPDDQFGGRAANCVEPPQVPQKKDFPYFLQLSKSVQTVRLINDDTLDFLTGPAPLQRSEPEKWDEVWLLVCRLNVWLQMVWFDAGGDLTDKRPYCISCNTWATTTHLLHICSHTAICALIQEPLLQAIVTAATAEEESRSGSNTHGGTSHGAVIGNKAIEGGSVQSAPADSVVGPLGYASGQWQLCASTARCPKPGCHLKVRNGPTDTHCCYRCAAAHARGRQRLDRDPISGMRWKKEHGPDCTLHHKVKKVGDVAPLLNAHAAIFVPARHGQEEAHPYPLVQNVDAMDACHPTQVVSTYPNRKPVVCDPIPR